MRHAPGALLLPGVGLLIIGSNCFERLAGISLNAYARLYLTITPDFTKDLKA
jgi:hypothetical protein